MRLSIIGTAGRKDDEGKLNPYIWRKMCVESYRFIIDHEITHVVSGGAAYADHLAVTAYNIQLFPHLTLALPTHFDGFINQFDDNQGLNWRDNPGSVANYYHKKFSDKVGIFSLMEIGLAIQNGAKIIVKNGFFERNSIVAESEMIMAFTFGDGPQIKDGGTADTVKKHIQHFNSNKGVFHYNLNDLKLYENGDA